MEQLTLNITDKSIIKIIASSAYNFNVEFIEQLGKDDSKQLIDLSKDFEKHFENNFLLNEENITKYFNKSTFPFIARLKGKIIGYIIGAPLEYFNQESWSRYDTNLNKNNTVYTYAFLIKNKYRKSGGYAKTLKKIYLNSIKKKGYIYNTGHVSQGISKNFSNKSEVVKIFQHWYGSKTPFEYYRRIL
tara:strand:- start:1189 stop:1752 length:564 start_codon:yes stop_codon:yes gene_type:complete